MTVDDGNLKELKERIREDVSRIKEHKEERSSINAAIKNIREGLHAKGIKKKALDGAMAYLAMDEDEREGFDIAYDIVREAMGAPYKPQGDLFDAEKQADAAKAAKAATAKKPGRPKKAAAEPGKEGLH